MDLVSPESLEINSACLQGMSAQLHHRYIDSKKLPGYIMLLARGGDICHLDIAGQRDIERNQPMTLDTIFRLYSMTKPVTAVALMTLWEKGLFSLDEPVHRYIPEFCNLQVYKTGAFPAFQTQPCRRSMQIRDLLTHTSGLTYDFLRQSNIDYAYRKLQIGNPAPGYTLKDMIGQLAGLPLEFSPGGAWNYSLGIDVCGYLVEVLSGMSLANYMDKVLFKPLGMDDTTFNLRSEQCSRFGSCYQFHPAKGMVLIDDGQSSRFQGRSFFSGGGGLLSTTRDYFRFCQMLANGGTLEGVRILGQHTLALMVSNHLPDNADLARLAYGHFTETRYDGVGFGLGLGTRLDPVAFGTPASEGSYFWSGLAGTQFLVDPQEELMMLFMTQLMPGSAHNLRMELEAMVYAALD